VIGGANKEGILSSIERMQNGKLDCWEKIPLKDYLSGWTPRMEAMAMPLDQKSIIIFGGEDGKNICDSTSILKFLDGQHFLEKGPYLSQADHFFSTMAPISDGTSIYALSSNRHIHIFNKALKSWKLVPRQEWLNSL